MQVAAIGILYGVLVQATDLDLRAVDRFVKRYESVHYVGAASVAAEAEAIRVGLNAGVRRLEKEKRIEGFVSRYKRV
eukprot:660413-Amorphochlora_amoeboformis.AAC.1